MNTGYTSTQAGASGARLVISCTSRAPGSSTAASAGRMFMLIEATTDFLALIGTTLSCLTTRPRHLRHGPR